MKKIIYICLFFLVNPAWVLSQHFLELSKDAGMDHVAVDLDLMSGGIAFFDYNNDGFDDLYLTGGEQADKLYENNGDGTFTDIMSVKEATG